MAVEKVTSEDKPGFIAMIVFALISGALATWWAISGDVGPALGFGVIAVAWVAMAFRRKRLDRARVLNTAKSDSAN